MFVRVVLSVALLACSLLACPLFAPPALANDALWALLKKPGHVVLLRHSNAPGQVQESNDMNFKDCSIQRNLDDAGRAQARRIGEAFRQHAITVGTVLSSPRCRCLDTGRLAFGSAQAWEPLQGALGASERRRRQLAEIRQRMAAHRDGPALVLVTHGSVVTDLTGLSIRMGEFVVLRRAADGGHVSAGQLYVD